jgi:hypothetical protein
MTPSAAIAPPANLQMADSAILGQSWRCVE